MTARPARERLLAAAEVLEGFDPGVAALLRDQAEPDELPDSRGLRKRLLRRIWRVHLHGLSRHAAAREIAKQWAAFRPLRGALAPGSLAYDLDRLRRANYRPLKVRRITELLDPAFD
jgi:hypothetical protein